MPVIETLARRASRFRLAHILLLTALLLSPALTNHYFGDDFYHYARLNGKADFLPAREDLSPFQLFTFADGDAANRAALQSFSILPWWSGEAFSWKFWRPVTELSLAIDYRWLRHLPLMHLHSILWFLGLVTLLHLLFRQILPEGKQALLATALFALNGTHGMMVGWLCSRSALLACFFGLLTLLIHHYATTRRDLRLYPLALASLALSLLSAEIGISTTAWLFAYALFLDDRTQAKRIASLAPYALLVVAWWITYKHGGFGVSGSNDFYIEPLQKPALFLQQLATHLPVLLASLWLGIPCDLFGGGIAKTVMVIAGVASLPLFFLLYRHTPHKRQLLFFLVATALSIFPLSTTMLQGRNVVFVSAAFSGILALAIYSLQGRQRLLGLLIFLHLVLSPLIIPVTIKSSDWMAKPAFTRAATLEYKENDRIIVLHAPAVEVAYLAPSLLHLQGNLPKSIWNLAGIQRDFVIEMIDDHTLRLTSEEGLINRSEQFVRDLNREPFQTGQKIKLDGLTIEMVRANSEGHPTEVLFQTEEPLRSHRIVAWDAEGFHPITLDALPLTFTPEAK